MTGLSLDAGALIAFDRGDARVRALLRRAVERGMEIHVVPEVVAQVWRGGPRQARTAALLETPEVETPAYDADMAKVVGRLCGLTGHSDVVDAHVVAHARIRAHTVVTSDADDLASIDATVRLIVV